ncbi:MAG: DUF4267 domain-containing protein [Chloroflexi bacterium]|nr:DUF4267 domain-containing protein [Chloroflexota bacterium]
MSDLEQHARLRQLASGLGLGSMAFGAAPILAPRFFAQLFGLKTALDPTASVAVRSVGVRDLVIGIGLWSAASHGGRYAPWVLARALSDTGDALACAVALAQGADRPGFKSLAALAAGAAAGGFALWLAARSQPEQGRLEA